MAVTAWYVGDMKRARITPVLPVGTEVREEMFMPLQCEILAFFLLIVM